MPFFTKEDVLDGIMSLPYEDWARIGLLRAWVACETRQVTNTSTDGFARGYVRGMKAACADLESRFLELRRMGKGHSGFVRRVAFQLRCEFEPRRLESVLPPVEARGFQAGYLGTLKAAPFICRIR